MGPLLPKLGLKAAAVAEQLAWWTELGDVLCGTLGMDPSNLNAAERCVRVHACASKLVLSHAVIVLTQ